MYNINDDKQYTYKRVVKKQDRTSMTDWILCSKSLHKNNVEYKWTTHSDHCIIEANL